MPRALVRLGSAALALVAVAAVASCGADTSATFNPDGSVTVGLKFLFPKSIMQGTNGTSVSGFNPTDIANANKQLQQKYPGGKVTVVTEGDESGAQITIPFKTEKDAFAFLTQPSKLNPSSATSGSNVGLNLANTGGMFSSATHTTNGNTDIYTFMTLPQQQPSPSPGGQQVITNDELESIFTLTFAITVPHVITSAPGALFSLDRKTAIWKLHWLTAETLTATTGADVNLTASTSPLSPDWRLTVAGGFSAIAAGFLLGMFVTWRGLRSRARPAPVAVPVQPETPAPAAPDTPFEFHPGPPPGAPPPTTG